MNNLMDNIKKLRSMTGAGFLDCKKALEDNNSNIDESVTFLRKKGLAKASKKSNRTANEGAVGIYKNEKVTLIIEVNTETDFAAKNEVFLNFMDKIGNYACELNPLKNSVEFFLDQSFDDKKISDYFKEIISKIGENIVLNKLLIIENNDSLISSYVHNSYRNNIGKIAVILKSKVDIINADSKLLGKNLCMHIAASKPLAMNIEDLDSKLIDKEKDVLSETIKSSGKPENIIEKILEGKMKKFYSESTLMNQNYILDNEKNINSLLAEFSKNNKFEILDYNLVILGS